MNIVNNWDLISRIFNSVHLNYICDICDTSLYIHKDPGTCNVAACAIEVHWKVLVFFCKCAVVPPFFETTVKQRKWFPAHNQVLCFSRFARKGKSFVIPYLSPGGLEDQAPTIGSLTERLRIRVDWHILLWSNCETTKKVTRLKIRSSNFQEMLGKEKVV